jgi:broad specificity phosphatase PhoE
MQVNTVWVRHCESCSNVAEDFKQKRLLPPLCTEKGVRQALDLGNKIQRVAQDLKVPPDAVSFYCSFLPRSMQTAALAAYAFAQATGREGTVRVNTLCTISELRNEYEQQLGECVKAQSESISTTESYHCWLDDFNEKMQPFRVKIHAPSKQCDSALCPTGTFAAWSARQSQYSDFRRHTVEAWMHRQADQKPRLRVIVSHGAFMQKELLNTGVLGVLRNLATSAFAPLRQVLPNATLVRKVYRPTGEDAAVVLDIKAQPGPDAQPFYFWLDNPCGAHRCSAAAEAVAADYSGLHQV